MTMDDLLRDAVRDLAAEARPATDLARMAMVRGRRLRRRRYAAIAAVVVALIGVATVPYALLPHRPDAPAPAAVRWSAQPISLPGDWVVAGLGRGDPRSPTPEPEGIILLHRATGLYQGLSDQSLPDASEVQHLLAAPRGGLVAIDPGERRIAVFDSLTGQIRWVTHSGGSPQWSPDGRQLLFTTDRGYEIVDARTGASTPHAVDFSRFRCTACSFTWFPDGRQVALPIDDPGREPAEGAVDRPVRKGVQLFVADTGSAASRLPVRGDPIDSAAWSPEGTAVVIGDADLGDLQLVDVATGRVRRALARSAGPMYFVAPNRLLVIDARQAQLVAADTGTIVARADLPAGISGHRIIAAAK